MLEQQVSSVLEALNQDLLRGEKIIYEGIILNPMINTISEKEFYNFYLPCFAGLVNPPNWIINWTQVAGNPMAEVSVVDASGAELYRVPPLLASSMAVFENREGSLNDIFNRRDILKNSLGDQATQYLFNSLDAKTQELPSNSEVMYRERWRLIFERYGINPPGKAATAQTNDAASGDDMFAY